MDIEKFIEKVSEAVKDYDRIKKLEIHRRTEIRVWLRLFLNGEFIETFHNSETASTSFAYIERGERVFPIGISRGFLKREASMPLLAERQASVR